MSKIDTTEDIHKLESFNLDLLKEGIRQAELKMQDENNRKERIDQKVYFMLPFVILAIVWITKELYQLPDDVKFKDWFKTCIFISDFIFIATGYLLYYLLTLQSYSGMGRLPDIWLNSDVVSSKENSGIFGKILTKILLDYEVSILNTYEINNKRIKLLERSMRGVLIAPIPIIFGIICHLF